MAVLAGKTQTERNKIIAAILLGVLALFALYFAFGRSFFSSGSSVAAKGSPTPKPGASPSNNPDKFKVPTAEEQNFNDVTTAVVYIPGNAYAPDAGRNIFAFYEPPLPTPYSPTPLPTAPPIVPPTPGPTPVYLVGYLNPQSLYAGSQGFRLEVNGDRFTPDARIYFSQTEFPTTFINAQKLVTDIPANLITSEGQRQIIIQSPDGKSYSNQVMLQIQAPPRPGFQFIGMIGRKRYNNDTAYFLENGKPTPFTARLNDVVGGRFRLMSISSAEVVFEDTSLGFKHKLPIVKTATAGGSPATEPGGRTNNGFPNGIPGGEPGFIPYPNNNIPQTDIPGIPNNIPRYVPPQNPNKNPTDKKDVDDDGDDGDN